MTWYDLLKLRSRVGPKGQVVIAKALRDRHGIRAGGVVEQISTEKGVLVTPLRAEKLLRELDEVAEQIGTAWPRGLSAAHAVRRDRQRR